MTPTASRGVAAGHARCARVEARIGALVEAYGDGFVWSSSETMVGVWGNADALLRRTTVTFNLQY